MGCKIVRLKQTRTGTKRGKALASSLKAYVTTNVRGTGSSSLSPVLVSKTAQL